MPSPRIKIDMDALNDITDRVLSYATLLRSERRRIGSSKRKNAHL